MSNLQNDSHETIVRNFFTIKGTVTLIMTIVFSILSLKGQISGEQFMTVFSVVTTFYFVTQNQKNKEDPS